MNKRITSRSRGEFDSSEWLREGDGLLASARLTRATWHIKKRRFNRMIKATGNPLKYPSTWAEIEGLPRASMLLLGYAMEMYLKAGLAKAYIDCDKEMFSRDLKQLHSHNYKKIAQEIGVPNAIKNADFYDQLHDFVLFEARYPIRPIEENGYSYSDAVNERTNSVWSRQHFKNLCKLIKEVHNHVYFDFATSGTRTPLGSDGYIAYRAGGNFPPRITIKFSSEQKRLNENNLQGLRSLVFQNKGCHRELSLIWYHARFFEDTGKKLPS